MPVYVRWSRGAGAPRGAKALGSFVRDWPRTKQHAADAGSMLGADHETRGQKSLVTL